MSQGFKTKVVKGNNDIIVERNAYWFRKAKYK